MFVETKKDLLIVLKLRQRGSQALVSLLILVNAFYFYMFSHIQLIVNVHSQHLGWIFFAPLDTSILDKQQRSLARRPCT